MFELQSWNHNNYLPKIGHNKWSIYKFPMEQDLVPREMSPVDMLHPSEIFKGNFPIFKIKKQAVYKV